MCWGSDAPEACVYGNCHSDRCPNSPSGDPKGAPLRWTIHVSQWIVAQWNSEASFHWKLTDPNGLDVNEGKTLVIDTRHSNDPKGDELAYPVKVRISNYEERLYTNMRLVYQKQFGNYNCTFFWTTGQTNGDEVARSVACYDDDAYLKPFGSKHQLLSPKENTFGCEDVKLVGWREVPKPNSNYTRQFNCWFPAPR